MAVPARVAAASYLRSAALRLPTGRSWGLLRNALRPRMVLGSPVLLPARLSIDSRRRPRLDAKAQGTQFRHLTGHGDCNSINAFVAGKRATCAFTTQARTRHVWYFRADRTAGAADRRVLHGRRRVWRLWRWQFG